MNLRLLSGTLALTFCASVAAAEGATLTVDPSPNPLLDHGAAACSGNSAGPCDTYALQFLLAEFDPVQHQLLTANLTLTFYDDNDNQAESVSVALDGVGLPADIGITSKSTEQTPFVTGPLNVASYLQGDGLLHVVLGVGLHNQGNNDFYFHSASLLATWEARPPQDTPPHQPAPEPVELALFGTGLMAVAFRLRRKP